MIDNDDLSSLKDYSFVFDSSIDTSQCTFTLNGQFVRTEKNPPYCISGDNGDGSLNPFTLSSGTHTLVVETDKEQMNWTFKTGETAPGGYIVSNMFIQENYDIPVIDMLKRGPYWVYISPIHPTDYSNSKIPPRIFLESSGLRMKRLDGDRDQANPNLNARTELRINRNEPLEKHYMIHCRILFDDPGLQATFLQVMGKNTSGKTKPIFSLDTKGTAVNLRNLHFAPEPTDGHFIRERIATYSDLVGKENEFYIFYCPSRSENDGYIKVFLNGVNVIEKRQRTYYSNQTWGVAHQYGIYGTDGGTQYQTLRFGLYEWAELTEEGSL